MKKALTILLTLALLLTVFTGCQSTNGELITKEEAKQIALEHAGVKEADVKGLYTERDRDDGFVYYDVSFRYDGREYEYEIDAETGEIIDGDRDYDPVPGGAAAPSADPEPVKPSAPEPSVPEQNQPAASTEAAPTGAQPERLTETAAEDIALAHAGVQRDAAQYLHTEYDREDDTYEVEFRLDGYEYSYEIHAQTGNIVDADKEWDD